MAPDSVSISNRGPKFVRIAVGILLGATLLALLAGWFYGAQILGAAARAWVISDSITPADVVAVLAGGVKTGPFAAGDLYKKRAWQNKSLSPA
jgi:hypothetical protein